MIFDWELSLSFYNLYISSGYYGIISKSSLVFIGRKKEETL